VEKLRPPGNRFENPKKGRKAAVAKVAVVLQKSPRIEAKSDFRNKAANLG